MVFKEKFKWKRKYKFLDIWINSIGIKWQQTRFESKSSSRIRHAAFSFLPL